MGKGLYVRLAVVLAGLLTATAVGAQGAPAEGAVERSREFSLGVGQVYADDPTGTYFAQRIARMWTRAGWRPSATFEMNLAPRDRFSGRLSVGVGRALALPWGITFGRRGTWGPRSPPERPRRSRAAWSTRSSAATPSEWSSSSACTAATAAGNGDRSCS